MKSQQYQQKIEKKEGKTRAGHPMAGAA